MFSSQFDEQNKEEFDPFNGSRVASTSSTSSYATSSKSKTKTPKAPTKRIRTSRPFAPSKASGKSAVKRAPLGLHRTYSSSSDTSDSGNEDAGWSSSDHDERLAPSTGSSVWDAIFNEIARDLTLLPLADVTAAYVTANLPVLDPLGRFSEVISGSKKKRAFEESSDVEEESFSPFSFQSDSSTSKRLRWQS